MDTKMVSLSSESHYTVMNKKGTQFYGVCVSLDDAKFLALQTAVRENPNATCRCTENFVEALTVSKGYLYNSTVKQVYLIKNIGPNYTKPANHKFPNSVEIVWANEPYCEIQRESAVPPPNTETYLVKTPEPVTNNSEDNVTIPSPPPLPLKKL